MERPRETPPGAAVGIIGPALDPECPGLLRASHFARFQEAAGELASARAPVPGAEGIPDRRAFLAGHASAHAFMAGVDRVVLASVADPADAAAWQAALERVLADGAVDLIALPGLTAAALQVRLLDAAHRVRPEGRTIGILFDLPPTARPDLGLRQQAALDDVLPAHSGVSGHVVLPWAQAHAAGRPGMERVPGSILAAPLLLGASPVIQSAASVAAPPWPTPSSAALVAAGGVVLVPVGRRRQVGLYGRTHLAAAASSGLGIPVPGARAGATIATEPPVAGLPAAPRAQAPAAPRAQAPAARASAAVPKRGPGRENAVVAAISGMIQALETELRSALWERYAALYMELRDGRRGPEQTWPLLIRETRSVLEPYVRRGQLRGYDVRCDETTNEGEPAHEPVVEIVIRHPRRVADFTFQVGVAR